MIVPQRQLPSEKRVSHSMVRCGITRARYPDDDVVVLNFDLIAPAQHFSPIEEPNGGSHRLNLGVDRTFRLSASTTAAYQFPKSLWHFCHQFRPVIWLHYRVDALPVWQVTVGWVISLVCVQPPQGRAQAAPIIP